MSQTYRIGSLNFTGSQAVVSASLDVSGSGRFTDGLTVTGSLAAPNITGSLLGTASWARNAVTASYAAGLTISGSIANADYIDFNTGSATPAWKSGRVFWDNVDGALSVYNAEQDITLQVGQENWTRVRNNTGTTVTNGTIVRIIGAQGDAPTIERAQSIAKSGSINVDTQILGVATHNIEDSSFGYVTTQGLVRGLNTNAFTDGETLFVGTGSAGVLQNTAPRAPYEIIPVGVCVKASPGGSGVIYVAVQQPIDFSDLSTVLVEGDYSYGDLWSYKQSGSFGVWTHTNQLSGSYGVTGSLNVTGSGRFTNGLTVTGSLAVSGAVSITDRIIVPFDPALGTRGFLFSTNNTTLLSTVSNDGLAVNSRVNFLSQVDFLSERLGLRTVAGAAGSALSVIASISPFGNTPAAALNLISITGSISLQSNSYLNILNISPQPTLDSTSGSSAGITGIYYDPKSDFKNAYNRSIVTVRGDAMFSTSGTGSVYIGTSTTSSFRLDVSGSGRITDGLTVTGSLNAPSITGSLFGTSSFALSTTPASLIQTGSIIASVSTGGNMFTVASASGTYFGVTSTGVVQTVSAPAGNYSMVVNSNAAIGGSFGLSVVAGTNSSDVPFRVINKAATTNYLLVRGDGLTILNSLDVTSGSVNALRTFTSTGNTFLGSTPVDGGFKLDVNGTTRLQNTLTISAGGAVITGSLNVSGSGTFTGGFTTFNSSLTTTPVLVKGGSNDSSIFIGGSTMQGSNSARNVVIDPIGTYSTFGVGGIGQNVVVGRVGSNITTGGSNVLIGNIGGGSAVTTGVNNIFIGGTNGFEFSFTGSASKRIYISTGVELGTEGVNKAAPTGSDGWVFIGGSSANAATNQFYFGASPQVSHSYAASYSDITIYAPSAIGTDFYGGNFIVNAGRGTGAGSAGDVVFATSTTGSTGSTLQTSSNRVWVKGHTGFVGIGVSNPSYTLDVSGSGDFSGGLTVTGSATINDILVITPRTTTPANPASGSIIVSGSGATIRPYFWDGSTWTQMFT